MANVQTQSSTHAPRGRLILHAFMSAFVALVVVVLAVLPAEFGIDPTGFGKWTGIDTLAKPAGIDEVTLGVGTLQPPSRDTITGTPFRTDEVSITIDEELEYKVTMKPGDDMTYRWRASKPLYFEFHGHTLGTDDMPMEVVTYGVAKADGMLGRLIAPVEGIHGWYFRNDTGTPVEVQLSFTGLYELGPGILAVE